MMSTRDKRKQTVLKNKPGKVRSVCSLRLNNLNKVFVFASRIPCIARPQGYKNSFMLNSTEHENFPAHKCLNANNSIVGILTFMSRKNSILDFSEPEKVELLDILCL